MNLWSDFAFDNQQPAQHSASARRPRQLVQQVVVSSLRSWLRPAYVVPYCRALASMLIYRRCYWIDALGSLDAEGDLQPILALAQELARHPRPITLNALMLEATGQKTPATQTGQRKPSLPKASGLVRASWAEAAPTVLEMLAQSPAILLLQPLDPVALAYDNLVALYHRSAAPTELLLLLAHKQVNAQLRGASRSPALAAALTALLQSDRWQSLLPTGEKAIGAAHNAFIDLLRASMQGHFLAVQPISLFAPARKAAMVESLPYTLLFATRSKESLLLMNDAACLHHRHLQAQSHHGLLSESWFADRQEARLAEEQQQLTRRILELGRQQRTHKWPDLRQQLLVASFAQFTISEYDNAIRSVLARGEVQCVWRRKVSPNAVDQNLVPGNEDLLLWR